MTSGEPIDDIDAALADAFGSPEVVALADPRKRRGREKRMSLSPMMAGASGRPGARSSSIARCGPICTGNSCRRAGHPESRLSSCARKPSPPTSRPWGTRAMVRLVAYACLGISGALAAVYGYTTANSEAVGLLRALGWGVTAFVGGCCPAWVFAHLDNKAYARAGFTGVVGAVCATVTIGGSIAGISGTGDKYAAERAKIVASTKDDREELGRITREREAMTFTPTTAEVVTAAREAVASAERLRIAECGAENDRRGPSCRKRETDEQARREALSVVTANKATSDRAAALDANAATIRARIDKTQAVQSSNPGAAAISRLLRIEVDDAVSLSALLGALALELAGMAAMMRADAQRPVRETTPSTASEPPTETPNLADAATGRNSNSPACPFASRRRRRCGHRWPLHAGLPEAREG